MRVEGFEKLEANKIDCGVKELRDYTITCTKNLEFVDAIANSPRQNQKNKNIYT